MVNAVMAISPVGWTLRGVIAIVAVVFIYAVGASILRKFRIAPDIAPDPTAVVPVSLCYRCTVCGAEVTMTSAQEGEEPDAPRHCREDMISV